MNVFVRMLQDKSGQNLRKARLIEDHLSYEQLILSGSNFDQDEKTVELMRKNRESQQNIDDLRKANFLQTKMKELKQITKQSMIKITETIESIDERS